MNEIMKTIRLGKDTVSMMDPPNDGVVIEGDKTWNIGRNYAGMIVLRSADKVTAHPDFFNGMYMSEFAQWINGQIT